MIQSAWWRRVVPTPSVTTAASRLGQPSNQALPARCPRNSCNDFRVCGPDATLPGGAVALPQPPSRALPQDHIHRKSFELLSGHHTSFRHTNAALAPRWRKRTPRITDNAGRRSNPCARTKTVAIRYRSTPECSALTLQAQHQHTPSTRQGMQLQIPAERPDDRVGNDRSQSQRLSRRAGTHIAVQGEELG